MNHYIDSADYITASKLYNFMKCEHRVWRDKYGPQEEKIAETNPFVQLLWDRGVQHEKEVIQNLGEYIDISEGTLEERFNKTLSALNQKSPLIYQGVLIFENLLGIPDIIRLQPDGNYLPIEIKSGKGFEGAFDESEESGKPKKTYAVQLALYVELLQMLGYPQNGRGNIIDINCNEMQYDLNQQMGSRNTSSFMQLYQSIKENVAGLLSNKIINYPAIGGTCNLCSWHNSCHKWVKENDDLTGLFNLGKSKRDVIIKDIGINRVQDLLYVKPVELLEKKKSDKNFLKGLAKKTLESIISRAKVVKDIKAPVVYNQLQFPEVPFELFFDIEDDPTQEFVYLHGVYERSPRGCIFHSFTATAINKEAEKQAWADFWKYINKLHSNDFALYYYTKHEKTTFRRLYKTYPDVVTEAELESFFENPNIIDLYDIIYRNTDWPLSSYSLKSIAMYLGFEWRDDTPSGALSIQWFNDYIATKDDDILKRILLYNEDDCRATMLIKDKLVELSNKTNWA